MTLTLAQDRHLTPSRAWIDVPEKRRRAVAAVVSQYIAALREAHAVPTHGHVSLDNLRKYCLGARTQLDHAANQAVKVMHLEREDTDLCVRSL